MRKVHLVSSAFEDSTLETILHDCTAWAEELGMELEPVSDIEAYLANESESPALCHLPPSFSRNGPGRGFGPSLAPGSVRVFERVLHRPELLDPWGCQEIIHGRGVKSFKWALRSIASNVPGNRVRVSYGCHADQHGILEYPPSTIDRNLPTLVLVHGGFWSGTVGRDHLAPLSAFLAQQGFCVVNLEFRRGCTDLRSAWSLAATDVKDAIATLACLPKHLGLDLTRVGVIGHSSGAHIAHLALARGRRRFEQCGIRDVGLVSLAGVLDLHLAQRERLGADLAVWPAGGLSEAELDAFCPRRQPLLEPVLLLHGEADDTVPIKYSLSYLDGRACRGPARFVSLPKADHMDLIKPHATHWPDVLIWLRAIGVTTASSANQAQAVGL